MIPSQLIVFLGNIGKKYERTRHNAGFLFGDYLRKEWGFSEWKEEKKFSGSVSEGVRNDEKILFLKPGTFMNLSGKSVQEARSFFKIAPENIFICYDDKDMEFGKIRSRKTGSSGGHNGMESCINMLATQDLQRLKIGTDSPLRQLIGDTADFVLSNFQEEEWKILPGVFKEAEKKLAELMDEEKEDE